MLGLLVLCLLLSEKVGKAAYRIAFIALTAFFVLRFGQGTDWAGYCHIYSEAPDVIDFNSIYYTSAYHTEFGWKLLMNIFKLFHVRFSIISAILALFDMICINRFIKLNSMNPMFSLLLLYPTYLLTFLFSALREGLVIAVFLGFGIDLVLQKKWTKYIMLVFFTTSFHISSIILALVPFLYLIKLRSFSLLLFFAIIAGVMSPIWMNLVNIGNIDYYTKQSSISLFAVLYRCFSCMLVLFAYYKAKNYIEDNDEILLKIYLLGIMTYALLFRYELVGARVAVLFTVVEIALIPNLLKLGDVRQQRIIFVLIIAITIVMTVKNLDSYVTQGNYHKEYNWYNYPYISIFNKDDIYTVRLGKYDIYLTSA